jgi:serine/threonine protein kinase
MSAEGKSRGTNGEILVADAIEPRFPGPGFRLGEYVISEPLGHGAMATVFRAKDATGHEVALKIFQEGPGVSKTMLERFGREVEASKKLRRHPHILTIYATGQDGPFHYIAMEYVPNSTTLEKAMQEGLFTLERKVRLIAMIARALEYAHSHRMVHRDVKPSNIMIDEFGEPLLSDFGVVELIDWPSCTLSGALTGTPLYMSPEQARGERVGPASDLYSLGVVLYEAVTGSLPYSTQHCAPVQDVLKAVREEEPRRPRLFVRGLPVDLEAVILKAIEKNPRDRYLDAEAFAEDIDRALAGRPVSAHHFSPVDRLRHLARRHRRPATAAAVIAVCASGFLFWQNQRILRARYDELLMRARLKNALNLLAQADSAAPATEAPRAWQEIRLARKAMTAGDWTAARAGFQTAVDVSLTFRDARTAAIAQLDQARCEIMINRRDFARKTYLQILDNADCSPSIAGIAQMECLLLILIEGDRQGAVDLLVKREPPVEGPIRAAMDCLGGALAVRDFVASVDRMPAQFRNDAYLAAAVRSCLDGDTRPCANYLRLSLQSSRPPSEWPAPFARILRSDLTG